MIGVIGAAVFGACILAFGATLTHLAAQRHGVSVHLLHGTPAIALALGYVSAVLAVQVGAWAFAPMLLALSVCAASDLACGYVFDRSVALVFLAGVLPLLSGSRTYQEALLGAACGACSLGIPYLMTRGRAMGFADVKVAAVVGASIGTLGVLESVASAFILGGAYGVYLLLRKRAALGQALAFVPFLGLGTIVVVLKGAP